MGYERNDRRYGGQSDRGYGSYGADRGNDWNQDRSGYERPRGDYGGYGSSGGRDYRGDRMNERGRDYGNDPRGYDYQDRGFFERAGDEVRSWFGDDDAERRRRSDERYRERDEDRRYNNGERDRAYGAGAAGYGAGYYGGGAYGGEMYGADRGRSEQGRNQGHDPSYRSWRDRQMESFDRDYDDYRREHQSRFDSEFGSWRQTRQGQRDLVSQIKEHQEVVGMDGQHIGTVDHVRGDQIELTKNDKDADGKHHLIPASWVTAVDDKVKVSKTADQAKQHWRDEARDAGGTGDRGRSNLNRSFSGTY